MSWWARVQQPGFWQHPAWGVVLAFATAVGDIRLTPVEEESGYAYVGMEAFLGLAVGLAVSLGIIIAGLMAWGPKGTTLSLVACAVGAVAGLVVAGAAVEWIYNSYDIPAGRYAVLPIAAILVGAAGFALWFLGRRIHGEMVMLCGLTMAVLVPFVQERALLWAVLVPVVATYLWLVPPVRPFSRLAGPGLHFLALLAFVQQVPQWFAWTPFPFLSFAPLYLILQVLRTSGRERRITWWAGAVITAGMALLGLSTLVANLVRGLPWLESLLQLVAGAAYTSVFAWFWRADHDGHWRPTPTTA